MSMIHCYLVEVGVLLTKEDKEFECYNHVYDKKHGYFDEGQHYLTYPSAKANGIQ